jgi:hypothetical protein
MFFEPFFSTRTFVHGPLKKFVLDKVSSADKEILWVPGGHIGIMAGGRTAPTITWPHIDSWLGDRSAEDTEIRSTFKRLGPQERHVQPHLNSAHSPIPSCSTRTLELVAPLAIR